MKMNLRRQNFGQNVSRTFTKAVYPEKNGVRSIRSHNQPLVIGSENKRKDSQNQNSQRNLFLPGFLPNRKYHLTHQPMMCL